MKAAALIMCFLATMLPSGCVQSEAAGEPDGVAVDGGAGDAAPRQCTQMGCGYWMPGGGGQVEMKLEVAASYDELQGGALELCRNDSCIVGTLDPPPYPSGVARFTLPASDVWVGAWMTSVQGVRTLTVGWGGHNRELTDPRDGDAYRAELRTADGTLALARTGAATYQETHPNGPGCEPTCFVGTLEWLDAGLPHDAGQPPDAGAPDVGRM